MSKGIIVVDVPGSCAKCFYKSQVFDIHYVCMVSPNGEGAHRLIHSMSARPNWCPIKPIPEKIESDSRNAHEDFDYVCGWNACIDEILGKE